MAFRRFFSDMNNHLRAVNGNGPRPTLGAEVIEVMETLVGSSSDLQVVYYRILKSELDYVRAGSGDCRSAEDDQRPQYCHLARAVFTSAAADPSNGFVYRIPGLPFRDSDT